jgi:hypothetical protein
MLQRQTFPSLRNPRGCGWRGSAVALPLPHRSLYVSRFVWAQEGRGAREGNEKIKIKKQAPLLEGKEPRGRKSNGRTHGRRDWDGNQGRDEIKYKKLYKNKYARKMKERVLL